MGLDQSTGSGTDSFKSQNISDVSHINNEFSGALKLIILPCLTFQQQMFVGLQLTLVYGSDQVAAFQG